MLKNYLNEKKTLIDEHLKTLLSSPVSEYDKLYESMNYSLLQGGKRIRPILIIMVLEALNVDPKPYLDTICAIECIHTYSLIHDDLPAMDDDTYRRGAFTNHKVYGEAMAILAGDALLTYAFELIANDKNTTDAQKVAITQILAKYSGAFGMVGGQSFDIDSEGKELSLAQLQVLHRGKTGALFVACIKIALALKPLAKEAELNLVEFAEQLGLLFQITDDILDAIGDSEELGKESGRDEALNKATYVSIFGLEKTQEMANETADKAINLLYSITCEHDLLVSLVKYLIKRSS